MHVASKMDAGVNFGGESCDAEITCQSSLQLIRPVRPQKRKRPSNEENGKPGMEKRFQRKKHSTSSSTGLAEQVSGLPICRLKTRMSERQRDKSALLKAARIQRLNVIGFWFKLKHD